MTKILLVEDDSNLSLGIEYALKNAGFSVCVANSFSAAKDEINNIQYDLAILDVMLPDGVGYELCKMIRIKSDLPIIFLTACDDEVNIVMGLDIGGDDYITKPFRIRELISRINAVLRRRGMSNSTASILRSEEVEAHTNECKVYKAGNLLQLTALEYKLLLLFLSNPHKAFTRNQILENIWDVDGIFADDNTLSVYIRRLREKVENTPDKPEYIQTVRGVGYRWSMDVRK
ncbi:MAG: response regulator transcription factor [Clostridia bacterium]|nr:response regulator transcription factor [Clostridia bacterium]